MSFVGWFIFSIYVGIGFIALPMDCINSFRHRPKASGDHRDQAGPDSLWDPGLGGSRTRRGRGREPPPPPAPLICASRRCLCPQVLSISEARAQRKQLLGRATELMRLGEGMAGACDV